MPAPHNTPAPCKAVRVVDWPTAATDIPAKILGIRVLGSKGLLTTPNFDKLGFNRQPYSRRVNCRWEFDDPRADHTFYTYLLGARVGGVGGRARVNMHSFAFRLGVGPAVAQPSMMTREGLWASRTTSGRLRASRGAGNN